MRTIISAIAFAIVSMIVLVTSANAMSIDTHVDMDKVFYATTKGTYERYHNLSVECPNGTVIHLDKVPHAQGTQFIMSICTKLQNKVPVIEALHGGPSSSSRRATSPRTGDLLSLMWMNLKTWCRKAAHPRRR